VPLPEQPRERLVLQGLDDQGSAQDSTAPAQQGEGLPQRGLQVCPEAAEIRWREPLGGVGGEGIQDRLALARGTGGRSSMSGRGRCDNRFSS
jgi:hypothetical protein